MGEEYPAFPGVGKWTILGITSNSGAADFELQGHTNGPLYESVLRKASQWGTTENLMFGSGYSGRMVYTYPSIAPNIFIWLSGYAGRKLKEIQTLIKDCGLLVNASRSIIHAGSGEDFVVKK
jgi:orotidine-5'-phosphate decarboxylase